MAKFHEVLRMEQVVTESKGTRILNHAKLNLFRGEIAGLIGVNYSGKTTLAGGFTGHFPYTRGSTLLEDQPVCVTSIEQARKLGIFCVRPQSSLIGGLSVAENIFLTPESGKGFLLRRKRANRRARDLLDAIGLPVSEEASVHSLTLFQRVKVEVCKAILNSAKVIVFDTVASALPQSSLPQFQALCGRLREQGMAILLVEARIQLLTALCDRLFILREGRTVGVLQRQDFDSDKIVSLMIGHAPGGAEPLPEPAGAPQEVLLELQGIRRPPALKDLSLSLYRHEVLGALNVDKLSGATLERLLSGLLQPQGGRILLEGRSIRLKGPHDALDHGIAILPEEDGMIDDLNLAENMLLAAMRTTSRPRPLLNRPELRYLENELLGEYLHSVANQVSGDDPLPDGWLFRKKVAFCRALATSPKLMVLTNPTQRIDFHSRQVIYEDILSLKRQQVAALVISSNVDELVSVCDRIAVVQNGLLHHTFTVQEGQKDAIRREYGSFLKTF